MSDKEKTIISLFSQNIVEDMVRISVDKVDRKFWMVTNGSVLAIKRLSIKGCMIEHYEIIDCNYRFHIYQFNRKSSDWGTKSIERGAANVSFKELTSLREIVNIVDVYHQLENIWLLLHLLGLNEKICYDIVGYTFNLYFQKKSYNLQVIKI